MMHTFQLNAYIKLLKKTVEQVYTLTYMYICTLDIHYTLYMIHNIHNSDSQHTEVSIGWAGTRLIKGIL